MPDVKWDIAILGKSPQGLPIYVGRTIMAPAEWGGMIQAIADSLNLENGTTVDMATLALSTEEW